MNLNKRVIVVGMNPSNYQTFDRERKNHTFDRLKKWFSNAGVNYFSFVNCSHVSGKIKYKDVDYDTLTKCIEGYEKIVALGNFSSTVLSRINITHVRLPHPSPRNRLFNDKSFENKVMKELEIFMRRS